MDTDGPNTQPVVIVNQTFARKFFHEEDPGGRFLNRSNSNLLIVGVVADTVLSSASRLNAGTAPVTKEEAIYIPAAQFAHGKSLSLLNTWFQPSWVSELPAPSKA